jgi:hypothetical protein
MAGTAFLVPNGTAGWIKEVTRGTTPGSGTCTYIPVVDPAVSPDQTLLGDFALRGSPVGNDGGGYDQVLGVRHDEFDHKTPVYADTFPLFIKALLGGVDTVTTTTASYSHSIPLLNAATTGSQPPSYSICNFDSANYFILPGSQAASMNLTFGAEAMAEATMKWICNPYADSSTAPAPFTSTSFSSEHLIPAWDATITFAGGSAITYIQSGELTIDRKTAPIFTMGTKAPYTNFAGGIEVTGKFTCVVATNADPFSISTTSGYALSRDPIALVITLTDPADVHTSINDSVSFQMTQTQFENVKRTTGKNFLEISVDFKAEADTTDAATGYAPLIFTGVNGISAAF